MPLVNVDVLEKVFTPEQKKKIIAEITNVMVAIEGEPFRSVTWVKVNEVREGLWGIGGQPLTLDDIAKMRNSKA
jgi:4-oxalocrotonate tautomerase